MVCMYLYLLLTLQCWPGAELEAGLINIVFGSILVNALKTGYLML